MKVVTCCGCCSLNTGTIIIGASSIVLYLIYLIITITTNLQQEATKTDHQDVETVKTIFAVCYCVAIGISTMLIIGALKKNSCLMLPWLMLGVLEIVGRCINFLIALFVSFINGLDLNGVLWLIFGLIAIVIATYFWLVVYSYRKELLQEKIIIRMGPCESPHNCQQVAGQN